jgi:prenyltransferase beta subunit
VDSSAITALREAQVDDGGWGFGGSADADTTALAIQALLAAGAPSADPDVVAALDYLNATQNDDGGWGFDGASNTSSTAFAVQALLALGEDPEGAGHTKGSNTPISYLLSQQLPDGSFEGFDPLFATNQVTPALAGRTFCNMSETAITRVRDQPTPTPITTVPAPPTVTQTPPATAAPAPPTTGTGGPASSSPAGPAAVLLGALLVSVAGITFALRRR